MKKFLSLLLTLLLLSVLITGCAPKKKTTIKICTIAGPTGVSMAQLMAGSDAGTTKNKYSVTLVTSPESMIAKLASGEADIAAMPTNLAAIYNSKTHGGARVLAVNTLGVLHLLVNGIEIKSVADLKGETIYTTGQGANPEHILNYILTKNGIDPKKEANIQFLSENEELAAKMLNGSAKIALVPEPVATTIISKNSSVRRVLDMTKEWDKVSSDSLLMMGCVVASKDFVAKNKGAVDRFLKDYKTSIELALNDVDATATLCETYKIIPSAALAKKAIPNCNLTYMDGSEMQSKLSGYYKVLYKANKRSLGGSLPSADFYYKK